MSRKELEWYHQGLPCAVLIMPWGSRCGYVGVPHTHPLYGRDYSSHIPALNQLHIERVTNEEVERDEHLPIIPLLFWDTTSSRMDVILRVHGGVTYCGGGDGYPSDTNYWTRPWVRSGAWICQDYWWVGYDCGHAGDAKDPTLMSDHYLKAHGKYGFAYGDWVVRSLEYCVQECNLLASQLVRVR